MCRVKRKGASQQRHRPVCVSAQSAQGIGFLLTKSADIVTPNGTKQMQKLIRGHLIPLLQRYYRLAGLSLSRPRFSRIIADIEVKIWSLPKHENLTKGKKYCGKEEKLLLSNFSSFPQYFQYSYLKSPITYIFVKCGCSNYFFLNFAYLICRGTDISKNLIESLGFRDNESRLYFIYPKYWDTTHLTILVLKSVNGLS